MIGSGWCAYIHRIRETTHVHNRFWSIGESLISTWQSNIPSKEWIHDLNFHICLISSQFFMEPSLIENPSLELEQGIQIQW